MTTTQRDLALITDAAEANKELQFALTQRVDALTKQLKQLDLLIVSALSKNTGSITNRRFSLSRKMPKAMSMFQNSLQVSPKLPK
jgi:hypothetical protein